MSAFDPSAPGLPIVPSGGASLPDTPAGVLLDAGNPLKLVYLDAGGVGDAVTFEDATDTGMSEIMTALAGGNATEGNILVANGTGGLQLASTDPAAVRSVIGVSGATMLYASDCFAEAGSESASISGTGSTSTFTLTASSTARTYGTAGATAARVVCPIPAGARRIEATLGPLTSLSGFSGSGRFLGFALRNARDGAAPTSLWGLSINDVPSGIPQIYLGNLLGGANSGASSFNQSVSPVALATNGWVRASFDTTWPLLGLALASGASPTSWSPVAATGVPAPFGSYSIPHAPDIATAIVVYLQSFGGGSATSITARISIRVVS